MNTQHNLRKTLDNSASDHTAAVLNLPLPPAISQEAILSENVFSDSAKPNSTLRELDSLVNADDRVSSHSVDGAELWWNKGGTGRFFVQGAATRLSLILGSTVVVFGITVFNTRSVQDAYVPMVIVSGCGIVILCIERDRK
jgi:hypothetical protein